MGIRAVIEAPAAPAFTLIEAAVAEFRWAEIDRYGTPPRYQRHGLRGAQFVML